MYNENDLLAISGLQHLAFCPRQCALIHLERMWNENYLTATGRVMHDRVHNAPSESRGSVRTVRGLMLRSYRLGLYGVADVVEFHCVSNAQNNDILDQNDTVCHNGNTAPLVNSSSSTLDNSCNIITQLSEKLQSVEVLSNQAAVPLPTHRGLWRPYPVEYKRGNPKKNNCDAVQLCAQAMCLEEMLHCSISEGSVYYGQTRHRLIIPLDHTLRHKTEQLAADFHSLIDAGRTPLAEVTPRCKACSLTDQCLPGMKSSAVMKYLLKNWTEAQS